MASSSTSRGARVERSPESFESLQKRNEAVEILQSYEKLSWLSYARRESLQQTRLHYMNVVAGFSAGDEAALVDCSTDNTPLPRRNTDDDASRRKSAGSTGKGKERMSGASAGAQDDPRSSPAGKELMRGASEANAKKKRKSSGKS